MFSNHVDEHEKSGKNEEDKKITTIIDKQEEGS
jgi:hypothetical protein